MKLGHSEERPKVAYLQACEGSNAEVERKGGKHVLYCACLHSSKEPDVETAFLSKDGEWEANALNANWADKAELVALLEDMRFKVVDETGGL